MSLFPIEHYRHEGDAPSIARHMVHCQDADYAGSGICARVFVNTRRGVAYKVGSVEANAGYLAYVNVLARQRNHNPYTPKIYGVRYIRGYDGQEVFVVAMEALKDLNYYKYTDAVNILGKYLEYGADRVDVMAMIGFRFDPSPELLQAREILHEAYRTGKASWDLHDGNFMLRGDQIVITDPFV